MKIKPKDIALIALLAALTAIGSYISIPNPLSPAVPFTFQVMFALLAGLTLGKYKGALSQIVYVALGAIGAPVFAGGKSGIGVLFGPSGGYILGFIGAAFIVGLISERKTKFQISIDTLACITGVLIIYVFGAIQLSFVSKINFKAAMIGGVVPFIPFDIFKAVVATFVGIALAKAGVIPIEN